MPGVTPVVMLEMLKMPMIPVLTITKVLKKKTAQAQATATATAMIQQDQLAKNLLLLLVISTEKKIRRMKAIPTKLFLMVTRSMPKMAG